MSVKRNIECSNICVIKIVQQITIKINPLINLNRATTSMQEQGRKFGADIENISVNHHHIVLKSRPFSFENRKKIYADGTQNNSRIGVLRNFIKHQSNGICNSARPQMVKRSEVPVINPAQHVKQISEPIVRQGQIQQVQQQEQQYLQSIKQNLQLVPIYLKTCLKYTKSISQQIPFIITGIKQNNSAYMGHKRIDTLDWMIGVGEQMNLYPETVSLTVHYIDQFMSKKTAIQSEYILISLAALRVAAKIEESYADITARRFIRASKIKAQIKQLVAMEDQIINTLQFNLVYDTPVKYLQLFTKVADTSNKNECICMYYLQLCYLSLSYLQYPPLLLSSSIFCAVQKLRKVSPIWPISLVQLTGYQEKQLNQCIKFVQTVIEKEQIKSQAVNIVRKYSRQEYCSVATMKLHRKLQ